MAETRWDRLARDLNEAGVAATVDERRYPGGISKSITLQAEATLVIVHDTWWRKNPDVWTGWEVHVEGRADSIVKRTWPRSKKRGETVAAVQEALGGAQQ